MTALLSSPHLSPAALARLHAQAFTSPPPWSADSFATLLASPHTLLLCVPEGEAFALGRVIADEAELLTLATAPHARRRGLGRTLVQGLAAAARTRGAATLFLEVAEDNHPARALYATCGFFEQGRRAGYYPRENTPPVAALMLCKSLGRELT